MNTKQEVLISESVARDMCKKTCAEILHVEESNVS